VATSATSICILPQFKGLLLLQLQYKTKHIVGEWSFVGICSIFILQNYKYSVSFYRLVLAASKINQEAAGFYLKPCI